MSFPLKADFTKTVILLGLGGCFECPLIRSIFQNFIGKLVKYLLLVCQFSLKCGHDRNKFYVGQNAWHDIPLIMICNSNNNITSYLLPLTQFLDAVVQDELNSIVTKFQNISHTLGMPVSTDINKTLWNSLGWNSIAEISLSPSSWNDGSDAIV